MKFKKTFNSRVISLVLTVLFILNNTAYAIDLPAKSYLRTQLLANREEGKKRLEETLSEVTYEEHVNDYIAVQAEKKHREFLDSQKIKGYGIEEFYNSLEQYKGITVLPIDGLYENTRILEHIGLGRFYGRPIIYIDGSLKAEEKIDILEHARDEIVMWNEKRADLGLDWNEMRQYILQKEKYPYFRKFAEEVHSRAYNVDHILEKYKAECKSDLLDVIATMPFKEGDIMLAASEQAISRREFIRGTGNLIGWGIATVSMISVFGDMFNTGVKGISLDGLPSDPSKAVAELLDVVEGKKSRKLLRAKPKMEERIEACQQLRILIDKYSYRSYKYGEALVLGKDIAFRPLFERLFELYVEGEIAGTELSSYYLNRLASRLLFYYRDQFVENFSSEEKIQMSEQLITYIDLTLDRRLEEKEEAIYLLVLYYALLFKYDTESPVSYTLRFYRLFLENFTDYIRFSSQKPSIIQHYYRILSSAINECDRLGPEGMEFKKEFCLSLDQEDLCFILTYGSQKGELELSDTSYDLLFQRLNEVVRTSYNGSLSRYINRFLSNKEDKEAFILSLMSNGRLDNFIETDPELEVLVKETLPSSLKSYLSAFFIKPIVSFL